MNLETFNPKISTHFPKKIENKSIFEFNDYQAFLRHCQQNHPRRVRRALSLEEWAQMLGYKSPRSVGMILKGQRIPNEAQVKAFCRDLNLGLRESQYFRLLVERYRLLKNGNSSFAIDEKIKHLLDQVKNVIPLNQEIFSYIANWYFLALRKYIDNNEKVKTIGEVTRAFHGKLSHEEVKRAFDVLVNLGLMEKTDSEIPRVSKGARIKTTPDIPSSAARLHHAQMMRRAAEALDEIPVEEREFDSWTFRMNPALMKELKKKIIEWGEALTNQLPDENAEVYELCVQCFPLTKTKDPS